MTAILRFILFFLIALIFANVAQSAGAVQADFRTGDADFLPELVILESVVRGDCDYDSSCALLHHRSTLEGKAANEDGLSGYGGFEASGPEGPLLSILPELVAAERTAVQLEFPFARGASVQTPGVTTAGETFVRVAATPDRLNFSFNGAGGALPRTYAIPEATFNAIGRDSAALKSLLDLPGPTPMYYRYLQPPPGTLIQRGVVPGGEFGGLGSVPEVRFPKGF